MADRRAEREAARRAKDRRGFAIAAISTVVVIGGLAALTLTSSGWPEVRDTFFNADEFRETFPDIAKAFWLDVRVFCIVEVVVLILGLIVALIRTTGAPALFPVRLIATVYTDVFRGIPTVLLVYLVGFGVPALEPQRPADGAGGPGRDRARALLRRLRERGLPRGTALRASRPTRWGARNRTHRASGDAVRDPPAGRPAGRATAAQ
jgi:hypothetical protein